MPEKSSESGEKGKIFEDKRARREETTEIQEVLERVADENIQILQ